MNVTWTNGRHFGRFGLRIRRHVRLVREPIAFARIARDAGANDVFPRREAAFVARQDVIEIQLLALEHFSAVLTGVVVALEDVVPGKLHFLLRQPIEKEKHDDAWHPDLPRNRGDHLVLGLRRGDGDIEPAREIMRREIVLLVGRDDLRVPLVEKGKSTTRRANIDRLPEAIEHQNLTVSSVCRGSFARPNNRPLELARNYHPVFSLST